MHLRVFHIFEKPSTTLWFEKIGEVTAVGLRQSGHVTLKKITASVEYVKRGSRDKNCVRFSENQKHIVVDS